AEAYAASSGKTFIPLDSTAVTTTTTAAVTTTTLTTTTTTTTAVTTTEPAKQEPFRYGLDEWGFINDRDLLGVRDGKKYSYYLSDEDYNTMMSMLSDTEKEQIRKRMESPVYGYCYGMSVSSILGYYGAFRPSDLVSSTSHLAEIDKDNISDAVRSAVNYYQLMQYTKAIAQVTRATEGAADEKKLKPLIEALDAGKPAVLGYVYQGQGDNKIGHAVVAYDISHEAGSIPISNTENFIFDVCIRIYDNQAPSYQSHSQDLYINTNKWLWCIPMTDNPSEYSKLAVMNHSAHHSGSVTLVLTEPEIMNCCGLFGGKKPDSDDPNFKYDRACVRYVPLNGLSNHGALEKSPDGTLNAAAGIGNIRFSADMNADETIDERLAYIDSDVGFYLTPGTAQAMSMSMEYEHYLMSAKADQSEKMLFTPDAEIECKNTSGAYEMEMVIDREARAVDWHKITVSGRNGGNLKMQLEQGGKGIILSGDNLKNVAVRANTYDNEAKRTFTADYGSVRIYEIDEKTVGIAADTDGDGVYETEIPADTERQKGDADGDGKVTNKDAQMVLVAYTDSLGSGVVDLPEAAFNAADVDGDGKVGAGDAQYILIYYTENTIAGNPKTWEDLLGQ
ncbi:MAG TPA: hypothetical protein DCG49_06865, partial [Ruminococcus sp.]|nr:hypothetical protein [Ruminococcus sp.]